MSSTHEAQKHRRLLLVDDEPIGRSMLGRLLEERGYEVVEADDGAAALRMLAEPGAPRIALVDWNMGTVNGPQLCRLLRNRTPYVYTVLTTSRSGRQPLIEAMNSGADGFLQKPTDVNEVEAWLVAGQRIVELQDRLLHTQEELERRASHDALTGIVNRAALTETLTRELSRAQRLNSPVAVVLFDIDHFKQVNDTHGHMIGDDVLVEFSRRCSATVRDYDLFGRYGGEEFLLILPGAAIADACIAAQRLIDAVAGTPFNRGALSLHVTVSAGAASTTQGFRDIQGLMSAADSALYDAKRGGRARVCAAVATQGPAPR